MPLEPSDRIENYIRYARVLALNRVRGLPPHIEFDDVLSDAYLGLVDAARLYQPNGKFNGFPGYMRKRVAGELSTGLRERSGIKRKKEIPEHASIDEAINTLCADTDLDRKVLIREILDTARRILSWYDYDRFYRYFMLDEGKRQIATADGRSESTIGERLRRSIEKVKAEFQGVAQSTCNPTCTKAKTPRNKTASKTRR